MSASLDGIDLGPAYVAGGPDTWRQARREGVSATTLVKALGLSRHFAPLAARDAYDEVVHAVEREAGSAARWGKALEGMLLSELSTYTGREYVHLGEVSLARWDKPHHRASLDGIALDGEHIAECKTTTTAARNTYGLPYTSEIPDYVMVQVQWQMWVSGRTSCDLVVGWCDRRSSDAYFIQRDDEMISQLIDVADDFWFNHVAQEEPPPPDKYSGRVSWPETQTYSGRVSYKAAFWAYHDTRRRELQEGIRRLQETHGRARDDEERAYWQAQIDQARGLLVREDALARVILAQHGGPSEY